MQHGKVGKRPPRRPGHGAAPRPADTAASYWIYGQHAVAAALANGRRQRLRLVRADAGPQPAGAEAVEQVSRETLARLLPAGAVHQGIALKVRPLPDLTLDQAFAGPAASDLAVVLDQVSDPGNLGAILRSAAAFGARALVVSRDHTAPESGALAKTASGALEVLPIVRVVNLARALDRLAELGYWRFGMAAEATDRLDRIALPGRVALVLGAEGRGLRRLTREHCDHLVRLPSGPTMPSLNVSAAAAVALYICAARRGGA